MRRFRRLPLEALASYLFRVPGERLKWSAVFGNENPVEVEVGFGKGSFLLTAAQAHPETNFLGIEAVRKCQLFTATRLAKRQTTNVRLILADARKLFGDFITEKSLRAVHVYFPDPWWKRRHLKRRVFTAEFAVHCERALQGGGRLHLATDVEEYFGVMTTLVSKHTKLQRLTMELPINASSTNFERKALQQGRTIHRAVYERAFA